jgi:catechol 2,3-dioxygenase
VCFQVVHGDRAWTTAAPRRTDRIRLTHVVLNSHAVDETLKVPHRGAGASRWPIAPVAIAFMNCNSDHHTLAVGISDNDALNHIAFLMPDYESVMRGGGPHEGRRLSDPVGPRPPRPGNNLFNYFIDPFGIVIEYTAEVEQVDEATSRAPRGLEVAARPRRPVGHLAAARPTLKEAQKRVFFAPTLISHESTP